MTDLSKNIQALREKKAVIEMGGCYRKASGDG